MRFLDIVMKEFRIDVPDKGDTMGIPRNRMPQVKTADYPEYFKYLKDNGVDFKKIEGVKAAQLKPIQGEFSKQGVEKQLNKILKNLEDGGKPLIASSDDYIIDGHHRWLAAKNTRSSVTVFKADIPMRELLELTLKFPKVYFKDIYTEGYKLQLERDADMYVLHITDSETGKRTEVRGKSGYESGNYDADDKLHQLLDRIGKASNISDLMNGEVVGINPKHPDGKNAKAHADVAFNEAEIAIHKGNTKIGKNIDLSKSADGTFWLASPTADWDNIVRTGDTIDNAYEISSKAKLATWDDIDRYGTGELEAMGYDGVRMVDGDDHIIYQIWNTKILKPIDLNESAGVGRVVKGVNTTVDVGPNEIIKQVKKFGNDVDRDGFPKKHLR